MHAGSLATLTGTVPMPTVQQLLSGDIEAYRAKILDTSRDADPLRWAALHLFLGASLRLRASKLSEDERAENCLEVIRAFEAALATWWQRAPSRALRGARVGVNPLNLHTTLCKSGPDGVQMVVDASAVPSAEGNELIVRAIRMFRDAADRADRNVEPRAWVVSRSNLGCALTLLGERTAGPGGVPLLEEAIDVLQSAISGRAAGNLQDERATIHVNLAETCQALAARGMPGERLRCLEQSVNWLSAALAFFAPLEYRWLLQLDRASLA